MKGQPSDCTKKLGEKTYKRGVNAEINVATNAIMDARKGRTRLCTQ